MIRIISKTVSKAVVVSALISLAACSGSSDGTNGGGGGTTNTKSASVSAAKLIIGNSTQMGGSLTGSGGSTLRYRATIQPIDCSGGGTMSFDDETLDGFTFDNCVEDEGSGVTSTTNGTVSFTSTVDGTTETFTMEYSDFTMTETGGTDPVDMAMSGSMTLESDSSSGDYTIAFGDPNPLTTTIDGSTFTITGNLTMNDSTSVLNGDMTITVDGSSVSCTFTDFNEDTSTCSDFASACGLTTTEAGCE